MKIIFSSLLILACNLSMLSCGNKSEEKKIPVEMPVTTKKPDTAIVSGNIVTPYPPPDISPMDMCYYPVNYPQIKMTNATLKAPLARVIYSRPHLQGRKLFAGILTYGEPWRLGANEATELDLYSDVTIQGKKIKSGRYVLYCIPEAAKWTIVFNTNIDTWGLHPDPAKDVARFTVPSKEISTHLEYLTIFFEKGNKNTELIMAWDNTEARLQMSFN